MANKQSGITINQKVSEIPEDTIHNMDGIKGDTIPYKTLQRDTFQGYKEQKKTDCISSKLQEDPLSHVSDVLRCSRCFIFSPHASLLALYIPEMNRLAEYIDPQVGLFY